MILLRRLDPSSEHPTDFIDDLLQLKDFLQLQRFRVFRESQKQTQDIKLHAHLFEMGQFLRSRDLAREQNAFEQIEDQIFRPLPERVAVGLRHDASQTVEGSVEVVSLTQNGDVELLHRI